MRVIDWHENVDGAARPCSKEFADWLIAHGIEPEVCYRVELSEDGSKCKFFCYRLDSKGRKYVHRDDPDHPQYGEAATQSIMLDTIGRMPEP